MPWSGAEPFPEIMQKYYDAINRMYGTDYMGNLESRTGPREAGRFLVGLVRPDISPEAAPASRSLLHLPQEPQHLCSEPLGLGPVDRVPASGDHHVLRIRNPVGQRISHEPQVRHFTFPD